MSDSNLLELRGVRAAYEGVEALHGVDLCAPTGTIGAVLGPNGAGKTTMLKVAAGILAPTAGEILLGGQSLQGTDPAELAKRGLCLIPEGRGIFPNLSVAENLWMMTYTGRKRPDLEEDAFNRFPRLAERRLQAVGTLSGGEQQMLAVARAAITRPALLLLDEVSMGLAPLIVEQLFQEIAHIASEGATVVVVEQFARTVLNIASWAAVMLGGRVIMNGSPDEIAKGLHTAYLGSTTEPSDAAKPTRDRR